MDWPPTRARRASPGVTFLKDGVPLSSDYGPQGTPGGHNWPAQPPHNIPIDLPARLSSGRMRQAMLRFIDPGTGQIDWLSLLAELLAHIDHRVYFVAQPIAAVAAAAQVRPEEERRYLFIQNTDAADALLVGFGWTPTAVNCVSIPAGGFYEPLWVPQNDIQVASSGALTSATIVYANA
jgi:hypothetical protein